MREEFDDKQRHPMRLACGMACGLLLCLGCVRLPEPQYELQATTQPLTKKQQQQVHDTLQRLFGTPLHPRFLLPAATQQEGATELKWEEAFGHSHLEAGARVFQERCAGCHGATGDGKGEAAPYLQPKPRDYRLGIFKFTSTPYGAKPLRQDLIRTVRRGAKGTSMPAFGLLSDHEVESVVDFITMLAYRGELERQMAQVASNELDPDADLELAIFGELLNSIHATWKVAVNSVVMPLSPQPPYGDETIALGRQAFVTKGCSKCHGEDGKGQTLWLSSEFLAQQASAPPDQQVQINYDAWGNPAPAADLTSGMLHGGRRRVDVYRRIHNGINGTPMPSFGPALAAEPDTIWHLVHYINSVVEGRPLPKPSQSSTNVSTAASSE